MYIDLIQFDIETGSDMKQMNYLEFIQFIYKYVEHDISQSKVILPSTYYFSSNCEILEMTSSINDLPTEILFLIFKELRLKDISNCSNTCLRWLYCIEALFKNKGKIFQQLSKK